MIELLLVESRLSRKHNLILVTCCPYKNQDLIAISMHGVEAIEMESPSTSPSDRFDMKATTERSSRRERIRRSERNLAIFAP